MLRQAAEAGKIVEVTSRFMNLRREIQANRVGPERSGDASPSVMAQTGRSAGSPASRPPRWGSGRILGGFTSRLAAQWPNEEANGRRGWRWAALLGLLAALGGGCQAVEDNSLTYRLWDKGNISFCQPAPKPELALFDAPGQKDILVEYNALSDSHVQVTRLAYFMQAGEARIQRGKAPHFIKPGPLGDFRPIASQAATNDYFLAGKDGKSFTLFRQNQPPEQHNLPFYQDDHWSVTRVALTPLAVTGDAVIVGACAGVMAVWMLCQNGTCIH